MMYSAHSLIQDGVFVPNMFLSVSRCRYKRFSKCMCYLAISKLLIDSSSSNGTYTKITHVAGHIPDVRHVLT